MKKLWLVAAYAVCASFFLGCTIFRPKVQTEGFLTAGKVFVAYSGPKAYIAVADFDVKATKATFEIGSGLRGMLIAALLKTNRFDIIERQILAPAKLEQPATTLQSGSPETEKLKSSELIISASVTEFEPLASGGRAGLGGGGGAGSGRLGGLLAASSDKARITLDIRVIDNSNAKVLATTRIHSQASEAGNGSGAGIFAALSEANALSVYVNTAMEKAMRACIIEATRYIGQAVPANYYKH